MSLVLSFVKFHISRRNFRFERKVNHFRGAFSSDAASVLVFLRALPRCRMSLAFQHIPCVYHPHSVQLLFSPGTRNATQGKSNRRDWSKKKEVGIWARRGGMSTRAWQCVWAGGYYILIYNFMVWAHGFTIPLPLKMFLKHRKGMR